MKVGPLHIVSNIKESNESPVVNLFQSGTFKLASGQKSDFKIEMDALSDDDWRTLAKIAIDHVLPPFHSVYGVPRGGVPFANALEAYADPKGAYRVICDDVLTTGESIEKFKRSLGPVPPLSDCGVVVFSRAKQIPWWISPLFKAGWL